VTPNNKIYKKFQRQISQLIPYSRGKLHKINLELLPKILGKDKFDAIFVGKTSPGGL